jgi:hypothetical protein
MACIPHDLLSSWCFKNHFVMYGLWLMNHDVVMRENLLNCGNNITFDRNVDLRPVKQDFKS